jgi:hypothetical protein
MVLIPPPGVAPTRVRAMAREVQSRFRARSSPTGPAMTHPHRPDEPRPSPPPELPWATFPYRRPYSILVLRHQCHPAPCALVEPPADLLLDPRIGPARIRQGSRALLFSVPLKPYRNSIYPATPGRARRLEAGASVLGSTNGPERLSRSEPLRAREEKARGAVGGLGAGASAPGSKRSFPECPRWRE